MFFIKILIFLTNKTQCRHASLNSKSWLERRQRDRYVELAKTSNYRCRSAYKLIEIDTRYNIVRPGMCAIDLGAAPGSWTQVLIRRTNADGKDTSKPRGKVIAVDLLPIYPIEHATIFSKTNFTLEESQNKILQAINNEKVNLVVSDMAPNATGVKALDQDAILELALTAVKFAIKISSPRASCLIKIWDGSCRLKLEKEILSFYSQLHHVRPQATQTESTEIFLLARGFKSNINIR